MLKAVSRSHNVCLIGQEPDKIKSGWLRLASLYALQEIGEQKSQGDDPPQVKLASQEDFGGAEFVGKYKYRRNKCVLYCVCLM